MKYNYRVIQLDNPEDTNQPYKIQSKYKRNDWDMVFHSTMRVASKGDLSNRFKSIKDAEAAIELLKTEDSETEPSFKVVG